MSFSDSFCESRHLFSDQFWDRKAYVSHCEALKCVFKGLNGFLFRAFAMASIGQNEACKVSMRSSVLVLRASPGACQIFSKLFLTIYKLFQNTNKYLLSSM